MGKENQDGLIMDQSFLIIDEKKPGFPVSARIIQILAIIIGSWGFISVLKECLVIPVNVFQINAAVFVFTGIMAALCLIPSYDFVKLFFGLLFYSLFFFSRLPKLANGFYIIENLALDRMASYYNYESMYFLADYTRRTADTTLLVIMLLVPVIALLTIAIIRNRLVALGSSILFIPISVSFLLGLIPSEKYLVAYVAAVLYLSRSGVSYHNIASKDQRTLLHKINSRAAVWMSLMGVLIFFLLKLFVSEKEYDNISGIKDMKNDVQTAFMDFSVEDFTNQVTDIKIFDNSNISIGGLSGGRLGKTGTVEFSDSEQLQITVPAESMDEGIYLKGYVGSVYTGSSWKEHSQEDEKKYKELLKSLPKKEFLPVNQTYQLLDLILNSDVNKTASAGLAFMPERVENRIYEGKLEVEYKDANRKYIYAPYFTNYELLDQAYDKQDLYSAPKKRNSKYEFDYFFNINSGVQPLLANMIGQLGNYPEYEKLYRDYVYEVYTELPEEGIERIKEDFSGDKVLTKESSISDKIDYVKDYLEKNTQYTLSPGRLPKGKDFVEYFLYENKKGYCAHYASAATLMLRAMGVPARYVEGYAIGPREAQQNEGDKVQMITAYTGSGSYQYKSRATNISVMDYNAHAWVEVYIDGCGWIPVEFTPGSAIVNNSTVINNLSQAKYYMNKDKENVPTKEPLKPTATAEEQEINRRTAKTEQKNSSDGITDNSTSPEQDFAFIIVFFVLVAAAVSLFLFCRIRNRRNRKNTVNRNRRVIYLFMEIEKILFSCHGLPGKGARLEDSEEYVKEHIRYFDSKVFETFMETAKKARFGKNSITLSELQEVETLHQQLYNKVNEELPFLKKVYLKILLLM